MYILYNTIYIRIFFMFSDIIYVFSHSLLVQKYLCKNMYNLNPCETHCGKSMIPFHAIWGLCWYNFNISFDIVFVHVSRLCLD